MWRGVAWALLGAIPATGRGREALSPTPTGAWHRGLPQSTQGQEVLAGGESGQRGPACLWCGHSQGVAWGRRAVETGPAGQGGVKVTAPGLAGPGRGSRLSSLEIYFPKHLAFA